jgi:hypothetical protein
LEQYLDIVDQMHFVGLKWCDLYQECSWQVSSHLDFGFFSFDLLSMEHVELRLKVAN